jgi:hypothetical protein
MKAPTRNLSAIKYITIHHSATVNASQDMATLKTRARVYDTQHSKKSYALETDGKFGYKWISYHYLVSFKGDVLQVQDIKFERNHAGDRARGVDSHNIYGIAICVDMNTTTHKISNSVKRAIATIIYNLERQLGKRLTVRTHKETSLTATACAGVLMGTHKTGVCKEIIDMVNEMYKPPVNTCEQELSEVKRLYGIALKDIDTLSKNNEVLQNKIDNAIKELS